jgi:hypothetical protein
MLTRARKGIGAKAGIGAGWPSDWHKIFVALIKKHSNYGRPIQSDISFSKRELMRLPRHARPGAPPVLRDKSASGKSIS